VSVVTFWRFTHIPTCFPCLETLREKFSRSPFSAVLTLLWRSSNESKWLWRPNQVSSNIGAWTKIALPKVTCGGMIIIEGHFPGQRCRPFRRMRCRELEYSEWLVHCMIWRNTFIMDDSFDIRNASPHDFRRLDYSIAFVSGSYWKTQVSSSLSISSNNLAERSELISFLQIFGQTRHCARETLTAITK